MPKGIYKHPSQCGFQKGHKFYGDLKKPNYFKKRHIPWHKGKKVDRNKYPNMGHLKPHTKKTIEKIKKKRAKQVITKKHRQNISRAHKGEKSYLWRGGITPKNRLIRSGIEFRLWREAVFARDNWTCQKCGVRSGNRKRVYLHSHHIKSFADFPELRFAIDNGITLCKACHTSLHHKGKKWRIKI